MRYFIVDAFTSEPFGGNPAGVVLLEPGKSFPSDELMRLVAAELRYSETAFVRPDAPREFTIRYFTPCGEVDLCGHATIAAFGVLRAEGVVAEGDTCLNRTRAGDLRVNAGRQVMMTMAPPVVLATAVDAECLCRVMGVTDAMRHPSLPVEIVSTGLPDIMLPVPNVDALHALCPDMDALARLSRELGVTGVHAFALTDDKYTAHTRNFAPLYGIPEEAATGTASGALTYYLARQGLIAAPAACCFLQGEAMRRPSLIVTRLHTDGTIEVGGECCLLACGTLLPGANDAQPSSRP
ncbi:MAG: PhzF family phenazine biosynthesis protein [Muribaculaceae bacterium]|nr:PhzF family phenazine biosynthesis protein [Muribaculaceae bacterium]